MRVHPAAAIFPMQAEDALQSLAESIKANGLRYPIVVRDVPNEDGEIEQELIDGRNRLRACEIADVEPTFIVFEGDDDAVVDYIEDVNCDRRDLKTGQKAMARAILRPDPAKLKRRNGSPVPGINSQRISEARLILRHSRALADDVLAGRVALDAAFATVKKEQTNAAGIDARKAHLREEAPDLADLVADERLTLDEACAANDKRQSERAHRLAEAQKAASGLWRDISVRLGVIAHGAELGSPYVLPADERETAEHVMNRLRSLLENH